MDAAYSSGIDDFSLIAGGPSYRLMRRVRLIRHGYPSIVRRAVAFSLITWLPLLIISAAQGLALGDTVRIPFLLDFAAYVRFLIAIPLLIVAEIVVDPRTRATVKHFVGSGLVREEDAPAFESALHEAKGLRDLIPAEIALLGIAYAVILTRVGFGRPGVSTWYYIMGESGGRLSLAGWWYILVSLPIFQFLLYRWLWRLAIWTWFLWRVSRLDLQLTPIHPDQAGGLGFLEVDQLAFGVVIFAAGSVLSAAAANSMAYQGASFDAFQNAIIGFVVLSVIIFLAPLYVFSGKLVRVKVQGLLDYGALGNIYTRLFVEKWVKGQAPEGETILGSADIQSLADLGSSFEIIRKMRVVPVSVKTILYLAWMAFIPMIPLLLMVIPLYQIVRRILGILG